METILQSGRDPSLEVRFEKNHDRFEHAWWLINKEIPIEIMSSVEGGDSDDWPDSPPIQDLTFEQRDKFDVVLGLGQAGSAHWSSSFKNHAVDSTIEIEHACRLGNLSGDLGCVYDVVDWEIEVNDQKIFLSKPGLAESISLETNCLFRIEGARICFRPKSVEPGKTTAWKLVIKVVNKNPIE